MYPVEHLYISISWLDSSFDPSIYISRLPLSYTAIAVRNTFLSLLAKPYIPKLRES